MKKTKLAFAQTLLFSIFSISATSLANTGVPRGTITFYTSLKIVNVLFGTINVGDDYAAYIKCPTLFPTKASIWVGPKEHFDIGGAHLSPVMHRYIMNNESTYAFCNKNGSWYRFAASKNNKFIIEINRHNQLQDIRVSE